MFCCTRGGQKRQLQADLEDSAGVDRTSQSHKTSSVLAGKRSLTAPAEAESPQISSWLQIHDSGELTIQEASIASAAREFGVADRDIRLIDPQEGSSLLARVLVRSSAVLVCLEGLRLVIGQTRALLLSVPGGHLLEQGATPYSDNPHVRDLVSRLRISAFVEGGEDLVDKSLAFELVVLEWALATASKLLSEEALAFEQASQPVLESIAKKVTRNNLAEFRRVKLGSSGLVQRADRLRQELASLLDDPQDIVGLHLSRPSATSDTQEGERSSSNRQRRRRRGRERQSGQRLDSQDRLAKAECTSLVECYLIQIEGALNALRAISNSTGDTEDMVKLSLKLQRIRLGHHC